MKKRVLALVLALTMALSLLPVTAMADSTHTHNGDDSWSSDNETQHWHVCTAADCDAVDGKYGHEDHKYNSTGKCKVCGYQSIHEHTWMNTWNKTSEYHFRPCTGNPVDGTGECYLGNSYHQHKKDYAPHTFDKDGYCTVCRAKTKSAHVHAWDESTYLYDQSGHYYECRSTVGGDCYVTENVNKAGHKPHTLDSETGECAYCDYRASKYTVTLNTNEGNIATGKDVTSYFCGIGATLPVAADMAKAGYTFAGWYTDSAFSGTAVSEISNTDTGDKTFYAKWTAVPAARLESLASLVNVDGKTVTFNLDPSKEYNVLISEFSGDEYNSSIEAVVNAMNANLSQQEVISGPLTDDMIRDYINNPTGESDMRLTCLETGEALVSSYGPVTVSDGALILLVELKSGDKYAYNDAVNDDYDGDYYITYGAHAAFIPAKASNSTTPPGYYPPVDTTPETEIVTPKTADAGIFLAVSMSILSVTGSAVLLKKKED